MVRPFITATVTGDAEVIQTISAMPDRTRRELVQTTRRLAIELQGYVKSEKLSGQVLRNRTGTLRRSIYQRVTEQPMEIRGIVGTNVSYGAVHENGYQGKRLMTMAFGRPMKFPVWASVNIPKRSFLRSSLKDKSQRIKDELTLAVHRGHV